MKNYFKNFYLLIILILIFSFIFFDFTKFCKNILLFQNNLIPSNNLVVLTGGTNRIKQTLNLFIEQSSKNYNLLISGAGKGFNKKIVSSLLPETDLYKNKLHCCIYIENKSKDTMSNALETYRWITKNNFKSITLITSDYHMQRALIEFKKILINIKIIPFVLKNNNQSLTKKIKNYFFEYLKFTITRLRIILI